MKVLHVITSMLSGGAEKLMIDLLPRFKAKSVDVELAVFNAIETPFMNTLSLSDIKIHRFHPAGCNVYSLSNLTKLYDLVHCGNYDIVHTHNTPCQLFLALCPHIKGVKYVTTEHNTTNRRRKYPILKLIDRFMYSRYDRVICVSDTTLANLLAYIGADSTDKFYVIPNGIDISAYHNNVKEIDISKPIILTMVAAFRRQKDHETPVRALSLLPDRYKLYLVGEGTTQSEIKQLAKDLGLSDRVVFTVMLQDIPKVLYHSDIMIHSSHYEGLSLACLECMASGRPLVASDAPGVRSIAKDAAIIFEKGNPKELSEKLLTLVDNPGLYKDVAEKCMSRAARYDVQSTCDNYLSVYDRLLKH